MKKFIVVLELEINQKKSDPPMNQPSLWDWEGLLDMVGAHMVLCEEVKT